MTNMERKGYVARGESESTVNDSVNHPSHYNNGSKEVIDMMLDVFGKEAVMNFCELNAFKYRMRAGLKGDAMEDLNKALWYENKLTELKSSK